MSDTTASTASTITKRSHFRKRATSTIHNDEFRKMPWHMAASMTPQSTLPDRSSNSESSTHAADPLDYDKDGSYEYYNNSHHSSSFWSSRAAMGCYLFVLLSLWTGDIRFLHGITLVLIVQTFAVLRRWGLSLYENFREQIQDCIDVSRGYLRLLKNHTMAFVDHDQGEHLTLHKVTAATTLYFHNLQFYAFSAYLSRRNRIVKNAAMLDSKRRFSTK